MENKEIEKGNKLIAEFMNAETDIHKGILLVRYSDLMFAKAAYHKSWDWLMPVVEKIRYTEQCSDFNINYDCDCLIQCEDYNIEFEVYTDNNTDTFNTVYKAVVEFIKWYNKNK